MKDSVIKYYQILDKLINSQIPLNNTLLSGSLGIALYYATVYTCAKKDETAEKAIVIMEDLLHKINKNETVLVGTSLSSGSAGLAYVLNELQKQNVIELDSDEELIELDEFLYNSTLVQISKTDLLDFLHGAMGVIHYFLQRLPNDKIAAYIKELVIAFCSKANETDSGIWFKNIVIAGKDEGEINFSLSHGQSGFLLTLIAVAENGIETELIKNILEKALQFIAKYRKETDIINNDFTLYPFTINAIDNAKKNYGNRLAWCYGDLGIALLCIKAGLLLQNKGWVKYGNIIGGISCMRKSIVQVGASDSHFCHGTSGLAQFYKHLYDITQKNVYKDAWYHWINETIQLLPAELEKHLYKGKECDLLEGLVGVNLALLSYLYPQNSNWSKLLLI